MALHGKARHEFVFGEPFARVQPAEDDVFFQRLHGGLDGVGGLRLQAVGRDRVHGPAYFPGTVSRVTAARRKSKSTPWSACVTVCRNSLR